MKRFLATMVCLILLVQTPTVFGFTETDVQLNVEMIENIRNPVSYPATIEVIFDLFNETTGEKTG